MVTYRLVLVGLSGRVLGLLVFCGFAFIAGVNAVVVLLFAVVVAVVYVLRLGFVFSLAV